VTEAGTAAVERSRLSIPDFQACPQGAKFRQHALLSGLLPDGPLNARRLLGAGQRGPSAMIFRRSIHRIEDAIQAGRGIDWFAHFGITTTETDGFQAR
jgi:hypothetical protein